MARSGACPDATTLERLAEEVDAGTWSAHLDACPECRARLDEIRGNNDLLAELRAAPGVGSRGGSDLQVPGYEVQGEMHRGGQGVIYKARHVPTNRVVALKVLLEGALATSRQRRRFEQEIELVASLRHPDIVTVHDSGTTSDGRHFFSMDYVEGRPLDEAVVPGTWPASAEGVLRLFARICAAVSYAHGRGVIHRDLKPSNILIDEDGQPHVVDFGLAKATDGSSGRAVTRTGEFMGTLAYASPEQVSGLPDAVDVRTDVYAIGVMLYETLCGRMPYDVIGSMAEVLHGITDVEPASMRSGSPPYRLNSEIETIALKTLAKEKDRRYSSAEALHRDIENYLDGRPIDARRDSTWYVIRKTIRRRKFPFAAGAAFVVLLTAFGITMAVQREWIRAEADRASSVTEIVVNLLDSANPRNQRRSGEDPTTTATSTQQWLGQAATVLDGEHGLAPGTEAQLRHLLGQSLLGHEMFVDAEMQLKRVVALRRADMGPDDPETLRATRDLVRAMYQQRFEKVAEALPLAEAVHAGFGAVYAPAHEETLEAASVLAQVLYHAELREDALALMESTSAQARADRGERDAATLLHQARRADLLARQGRSETAGVLAARAVAALVQIAGEEDERTAYAMRIQADVLAGRDNVTAERWARRALATYQRLYLPGHPEELTTKLVLSGILFKSGQLDEAIDLARQVYDTRRRTLGQSQYETIWSTNNLAHFVSAHGDLEEAERLARDAVSGYVDLLGAASPDTLNTRDTLAVILHRRGTHEEAAAIFEEIVTLAPDVTEETSRWRLSWVRNYARLLTEMERWDDAEAQLLEAWRLAGVRDDDAARSSVRADLTALYATWGRPETPLPDE